MKKTIEIKHRYNGRVLFTHSCDYNTIALTVEAAVRAGADLTGAYLAGRNPAWARLSRADLVWADLADTCFDPNNKPNGICDGFKPDKTQAECDGGEEGFMVCEDFDWGKSLQWFDSEEEANEFIDGLLRDGFYNE